MSDTNVGLGMVAHKKNCSCLECLVERLTLELRASRLERDMFKAELAAANARIAELEKTIRAFAE